MHDFSDGINPNDSKLGVLKLPRLDEDSSETWQEPCLLQTKKKYTQKIWGDLSLLKAKGHGQNLEVLKTKHGN